MKGSKTAPQELVIECDWPCIRCGYNLRGLNESGDCPECGFSIAESLCQRPLTMADPRWLRRIRWAILLAAVGIVGFLGAEEIIFGLRVFRGSRIFSVVNIFQDDVVRIAWPILLLPTAWLLKTPESQSDRTTWTGRWLWPLVVAHLTLNVAIPFLREGAGIGGRIMGFIVYESVFVAYGIEPFVEITELWILLKTLEALSQRAPRQPMLTEIRWFRRVICALLLVNVTNGAIIEIARMYYNNQPLPGGDWLPEPWGRLLGNVFIIPNIAINSVWLYLPIQLLRFQRYVQPQLTRSE